MSSQILLVLFLLMCCIAMVNLLVGLAVSELEQEMTTARKVQNQVLGIFILEKAEDNFWHLFWEV